MDKMHLELPPPRVDEHQSQGDFVVAYSWDMREAYVSHGKVLPHSTLLQPYWVRYEAGHPVDSELPALADWSVWDFAEGRKVAAPRVTLEGLRK